MKLFSKLRPHWGYLAAILVLAIIFFFPLLSFTKFPVFGNDFTEQHISYYINLQKAWFEDGKPYAFWNPTALAGTPQFAKIHTPGPFYPLNILFFILPTAEGVANITLFLNYLLAGIAMYTLVFYLLQDKKAAFIAALFYMFNGFSMMFLEKGWSEYVRAFSLTPFIFLLIMKAIKTKNWLPYTLGAGILVAIQSEAGGANIVLWTLLLIALFLGYMVIGKNIPRRLIKITMIGALLLLLFGGLQAVRLLPYNEHNELTRRAAGGVTEHEALVAQRIEVPCKDDSYRCLHDLIESDFSFKQETFDFNMGIIGILLFGFAVFGRWRNRMVLFFTLILILSIILAIGSPLMAFLWKHVPGFASHRYPHRALFLWSFAGSVLAGFGTMVFLTKLKGLKPDLKKASFILLAAMVIFDLAVLSFHPTQTISREQIRQDYPIYAAIGSQDGIFRVHPMDIFSVNKGFIPLAYTFDLQFLYGYDPLWAVDYLPVHLSAVNQNPSKMMGMLNTKYVTAKDQAERPGFTLVDEYAAPDNLIDENHQTFLFENEQFLPRAYMVENAILLIGAKDNVKQTAYGIMLDPNFNPASTALVMAMDRNIGQYSLKELQRYKAIFLQAGGVDASATQLLQQYVNGGGVIVPDILTGEQGITEQAIKSFWAALASETTYDTVDQTPITTYTPDKMIVNVAGKQGFLVLSEKFALYDQWHAETNEEKDILYANGILSAIYLDGNQQEITLIYRSDAFKKGAVISAISVIIVLAALIFFWVREHE
ncbi:MAG: hypothetical protein ABIH34_01435 [Nanoarchaeota archaeon]